MEPSAPQLRLARIATSCAFFTLGFSAGIWFVHIPVLENRFALEPSVLGLILLCFGVGSFVFQPVTGFLLQRISSKRAAVAFHLAAIALLAAAINATSPLSLAVILFVTGATFGATNVSINTQGALVEKNFGRPVMSSFHGFFSLGTFAAAGVGGALVAAGFGDGRGAIGLAILIAPVVLWAGSRFLTSDPVRSGQQAREKKQSIWTSLSIPLALMMFLAFIGNAVEFSVNYWSALFLNQIKGIDLAWAVSGFAVFSIGMALMRFLGGWVAGRLGVKRTLSLGGVLIAIGMGMVVLSPWSIGSVFGFFGVALGLANVAPLLISQAALQPGVPSSIGIAAVATGLTAGFLLAPPIIGFAAQALGLSFAMGAMAIVGIAIALISGSGVWITDGGKDNQAEQ